LYFLHFPIQQVTIEQENYQKINRLTALQSYLINIKKVESIFMGSYITYLTIAIVAFVAVAAFVFYGAEQQSVIEGSELAPAAQQGSFASPSGLGADLNKEQWHEDPFADEAAAVRAAYTGDK
jgi:hypothetical protein